MARTNIKIDRDQFTDAQLTRFKQLRRQYSETPHVFTERELAWFRFLRWVYQTGNIDPAGSEPSEPPEHIAQLLKGTGG